MSRICRLTLIVLGAALGAALSVWWVRSWRMSILPAGYSQRSTPLWIEIK